MHPYTDLWGVPWQAFDCWAPPLGSPAPLPPSADNAQSDEAEEEGRGLGDRLRGQFVKNGHPRVANSLAQSPWLAAFRLYPGLLASHVPAPIGKATRRPTDAR
jgi:hypothetical protein